MLRTQPGAVCYVVGVSAIGIRSAQPLEKLVLGRI